MAMDGTTQETTRFAKSMFTTKIMTRKAGETFESRGKRGLKIFTPPTQANHADPERESLAEEAETDPEELQAQRVRNAYRGHARKDFLAALPKLSSRQGQVVELRLEALTVEKIARRLAISETTVRRHWQEAQANLRDLLPEWRDLFPLNAFVHATNPREAWIEHNQHDNSGRAKLYGDQYGATSAGFDTPDEQIDDRSEWHEKHGHSPELTDLARFSSDGQRRFVVPLDLGPKLESNYLPNRDKPTQVADDRSLTKEQLRKIDAEILAAKLEYAAATLIPLQAQAAVDGAPPDVVADVLSQVPGDDDDVRVAVERQGLLWRLCARRYEATKPARVAAMGEELRKRPIGGHGPAARTAEDFATEAKKRFESLMTAHIRRPIEPRIN
jgi:RNA polymerase sigma factor (sigma-70 family)